MIGKPTRDGPALVCHREHLESAAGRDDHRRAACLAGSGQEWRQRRAGDVAHDHLAVAHPCPTLPGSGEMGLGAERDRAGFGRRGCLDHAKLRRGGLGAGGADGKQYDSRS